MLESKVSSSWSRASPAVQPFCNSVLHIGCTLRRCNMERSSNILTYSCLLFFFPLQAFWWASVSFRVRCAPGPGCTLLHGCFRPTFGWRAAGLLEWETINIPGFSPSCATVQLLSCPGVTLTVWASVSFPVKWKTWNTWSLIHLR